MAQMYRLTAFFNNKLQDMLRGIVRDMLVLVHVGLRAMLPDGWLLAQGPAKLPFDEKSDWSVLQRIQVFRELVLVY